LGICAEQRSEEWEVLGVRSVPYVQSELLLTVTYNLCSLSTLTMSLETYQAVS